MQSGEEKCKPKPGKEIQPFGVYVVKKFTGAQRDLGKIPNPIEAFARSFLTANNIYPVLF